MALRLGRPRASICQSIGTTCSRSGTFLISSHRCLRCRRHSSRVAPPQIDVRQRSISEPIGISFDSHREPDAKRMAKPCFRSCAISFGPGILGRWKSATARNPKRRDWGIRRDSQLIAFVVTHDPDLASRGVGPFM